MEIDAFQTHNPQQMARTLCEGYFRLKSIHKGRWKASTFPVHSSGMREYLPNNDHQLSGLIKAILLKVEKLINFRGIGETVSEAMEASTFKSCRACFVKTSLKLLICLPN